MALAIALMSSAQVVQESGSVLDAIEDTTQVVSIQDIVEMQELATSNNSNAVHFQKVWSRTSYFNPSYNSTTLTPKEDIKLGYNYNNGFAPVFKSDWGASLVLGHNYRLHKKPIANIVQINLDYTFIDLNVNHFKAEEGEKLFDSNSQWSQTDEDGYKTDYFYTPWCLEKYEANYGMSIGPSITLAPFTYIKVPQLHFLKFNVYYHIGYNVSIMWMQNDKNKDANYATGADPQYNKTNFDKMENALKMDWGHGMSTAFGFSVSWKSIGVGYEIRKGSFGYKAMQKDLFGNEKYKFDASTSRVYLTVRY